MVEAFLNSWLGQLALSVFAVSMLLCGMATFLWVLDQVSASERRKPLKPKAGFRPRWLR